MISFKFIKTYDADDFLESYLSVKEIKRFELEPHIGEGKDDYWQAIAYGSDKRKVCHRVSPVIKGYEDAEEFLDLLMEKINGEYALVMILNRLRYIKSEEDDSEEDD